MDRMAVQMHKSLGHRDPVIMEPVFAVQGRLIPAKLNRTSYTLLLHPPMQHSLSYQSFKIGRFDQTHNIEQ